MVLALGSYRALCPVLPCCLILIVLTVFEDRALQAELHGYREYGQRVRSRLLPGV